MTPYRRLLGYVRPHAAVLGTAFVFMFLTSLFEASPLALVVPLVDRIMADKLIVLPDYDRMPVLITDLVGRVNALPRLAVLQIVLAAGLLVTIARSVCEFGYTYCMSSVSQRVTRELRRELYEKLIGQSLGYFADQRAGALVSRITYDTGVVRDAISEGVKDLLFQPVGLFWHLAMLFVLRWVFAIPWTFLLVLAFVLPLVVYPVVRLGKMLKKISAQSQEQMADLHATLYESLSGIRVVQAFGMEDYEKRRFRGTNEGYYRTMMRSIARTILVSPITDCVLALCAAWVVWLGGHYIVHEGLSPGAFLAFLMALFALFRPFKRLSRLHSINQTALAAAERVFRILDAPSAVREPEDPVYLGRLRDSIEYRGVSFAYDPQKPVLENIHLTVRAGEIVAIVGPSGTGKTTLVNLLPRFYDPVKGSVLVDGQDIRRASLASLRNQIGIVTQETILFNDSVAANIAYGQSGVPHTKIEEAARAAGADKFIRGLPQGYQTVIGDRGFKLSGGEKQRIAIARAVLKNPPILILDEATSALDSESETLVQEAIQKLMRGRTALVIAHRLSTIRNASRIVVLQQGRILEEGRHEELIERNGFYRKIYQMQFEA